MIIASVSRWVCGGCVGGSVGKWSVVGWSVVGGSVVGGFNKTSFLRFLLILRSSDKKVNKN